MYGVRVKSILMTNDLLVLLTTTSLLFSYTTSVVFSYGILHHLDIIIATPGLTPPRPYALKPRAQDAVQWNQPVLI